MIDVPFNQVQILWTLLFAGLLILLIVLYGRGLIERYRWFSSFVFLTSLDQLFNLLLLGRIDSIHYGLISYSLSILILLAGLGTLAELGRALFAPAKTKAIWLSLAISIIPTVAVTYLWNPWSSNHEELTVKTQAGVVIILQLAAAYGQLAFALFASFFGLAVLLLAPRSKKFFSSTYVGILAGFTTNGIAMVLIRRLYYWFASNYNTQAYAHQTTRDDLAHVQSYLDHFSSFPYAIMILVNIWWINRLWKDENGLPISPPKETKK